MWVIYGKQGKIHENPIFQFVPSPRWLYLDDLRWKREAINVVFVEPPCVRAIWEMGRNMYPISQMLSDAGLETAQCYRPLRLVNTMPSCSLVFHRGQAPESADLLLDRPDVQEDSLEWPHWSHRCWSDCFQSAMSSTGKCCRVHDRISRTGPSMCLSQSELFDVWCCLKIQLSNSVQLHLLIFCPVKLRCSINMTIHQLGTNKADQINRAKSESQIKQKTRIRIRFRYATMFEHITIIINYMYIYIYIYIYVDVYIYM